MKTFTCSSCSNRVYFENVVCSHCNHDLAFDNEALEMRALSPTDQHGAYQIVSATGPDRQSLRNYCDNHAHGACNWLTPAGTMGLCRACAMNRTIPNLSEPGSQEAWADFERAKKRLVYQLLRFNLPFGDVPDGTSGLSFSFARNETTGHLDGEISVDFNEADDVWRESQRQAFNEPYRSLLGHLRHETGHYYWMRLVDGSGRLTAFRELFGDERDEYAAAIARHHHQSAPPADWPENYVSAYASAHPWEDWAETWAHYHHMIDAVETASAWHIAPGNTAHFPILWPRNSHDIYRDEDFDALMHRWIPLTLALNSLSRSMGHDDFYPFVIAENVTTKLRFIHDTIRTGSAGAGG